MDIILLGRPIRNGKWKSKWAISVAEYPFESWPPYCLGTCFIVSRKLAQQLYIASTMVRKGHEWENQTNNTNKSVQFK